MSARVVYATSLLLHVLVGSAVASTRPAPARRTVIVEVRRARPRRPPPPPPAPPAAPAPPAPAPVVAPAARVTPTRAPPSPPRARPRAAPAPATAAPSSGSGIAVAAAPDFGVTLGNDLGGHGGGGGGGPAAPAPAPTPRAARIEEECPGAPTRPRVLSMQQPEYPDAARDAEIEGRVRVELRVDETGAVVSARVLAGLGHGLDEAALTAARAARFEPATRCGRPVDATFTLGVRFAL